MKKLLPLFMAGIFLLIVTTAAFAAPTVSSTNPVNGATEVAVATVITIVFSEDMDPTTINDTNILLLKGGNQVSGTVTYDAATRTATFTPASPLETSTTYKGRTKRFVKNVFGTQMDNRYDWTFETAAAMSGDTTPPTVTFTDPVSGATNVPINSIITATFSEPMDAATITSATFTLNGGVTGAVTYNAASNEAVFTPSVNLSSNTTYTATITTGVKDLAGNAMAQTKTWSFTTANTDTTPPTVTFTNPVNGATGIAVSSTVTATFSEAMDAATITSATFTLSNGVTGTVAYDAATNIATFTPSAALANSTTYTATITTGEKDLAGNAMAAAKTWSFTTVAAAAQAPLTNYCQQPAFVASGANTLMPNVLLMIDNSGSMNEFAYKESVDQGWYYGYDLAKDYYGYFDSGKMYKYTSTSGGFFEIDTTKTLDKAGFWSGNFLNWLTMRRVDVVRKVLVGGKTQPRSASTANYLIGMENPDRDTNKKYNNVNYIIDNGQITVQSSGTTYNIKVYVGNNPPDEGLIIKMSDRIRFGIMFFNGGYRFENSMNSTKDGGYVAVDLGSTGTNLITQVENTDPTTWTPLAETLYEATRYFQATTSAYNGGTYSGKDPIQYKCQKNFVLILTDGESTKDQNIPGTAFSGSGLVTDPYGFDVKTYMDKIATNEGATSQWNINPNGNSKGSYYLEGVAYYAHSTDSRSSTVGKSDIPGKQNLTIYTVFAFDDSVIGRDILKKAAKYGGFEDKNSNDKPDLASEWDKNGNGDPDTYFDAQDGGALGPAIKSALDDILARVSSGTAASILSNSEGSGANILQAVFYPKKYFAGSTEASWVGEMQNLWYYIDPKIDRSTVREDSDYSGTGAHTLNLKKDYVADFYFDTDQTLVKLSEDTDGNGTGDVDKGTVSPDDVKSIWRAGNNLWAKTAAARKIFTTINGTSLLVNNFDVANRTTLAPYLQAANDVESENVINYVRGVDQPAYRGRTVKVGTDPTGKVWKLGDIVSSTPRLQSSIKLNDYDSTPPKGYSDKSYDSFIKTDDYKNRGMVYVGANDGMLHAFKLGTLDVTATGDQRAKLTGDNLGEEEWAYIPRNALPYLKYLADPNYKHLYYVDATSNVVDASIGCVNSSYWNCAKPDDGSTWRTILIGGMGLGGASRIATNTTCTDCVKTPILDPADNTKGLGYSSYFALDVTNQHFNPTTGVRAGDPALLWEFSDPALGYATTGPAVVRASSKDASGSPIRTNNGDWFAVFASGPTGPIDGSCQFLGKSDQNLKLFIVDLKHGPTPGNFWTIDTGIKNAYAGAITGGVIDTDRWDKDSPGNYQDDAIYIGYVQANSDPVTSTTTWTNGGVLRLIITHDYNPNNAPTNATWKLSKVIDGIGPVTTNIVKLQDRKNHKLWLYFGTGRYYYNQDDNAGQRRIFAVKEKCYKEIATHTSGSSTKDDIDDNDATCSGTPLVLTDLDNRTTPSDTAVANGWYINLDGEDTVNSFGAERVITDPVALTNGAVYFTTFKPTTDVCSFGGNTFMWGVKYDTGSEIPDNAKKGKALIQVSTGSFEEIDLKDAFTAMDGRKMGTPMIGKPPSDPPPIISNSSLKPVKKIIHVQER
ncbi:MAG: type IV pilus assembly protein [Geobacteraceae bacterium]|nr:MAG: type IV pilus assembly protein [Geobacteraceae bacterium]